MALFRWLPTSAFLAASVLVLGCINPQDSLVEKTSEEENLEGASTEPITDVNQSSVKYQSIGNCWVYATLGWAESLNKSSTGVELNLSESYVSYNHWFEQILAGNVSSTGEIQTGGWWYVAAELINRYGVVKEGEFIAQEATADKSLRQKEALLAMAESLTNGPLKTTAARRNRALVRSELNKAWKLDPSVTAQLDKVFGSNVSRTLDKTAKTDGTTVLHSKNIPIAFKEAGTGRLVKGSLADAIGKRSSSSPSTRVGPLAWNASSYPYGVSSRRQFLKRIQRALHNQQPVVISWFVDFNAMDNADQGEFKAPPATPGRQGGHMVVLEDYQVDTHSSAFGVLQAGVLETRTDALQAALADQAEVIFLRAKNSWGLTRPTTHFVNGYDGYNDLYMKYLNGPVAMCGETANGDPDPTNCYDGVPFTDALFPPGYLETAICCEGYCATEIGNCPYKN